MQNNILKKSQIAHGDYKVALNLYSQQLLPH